MEHHLPKDKLGLGVFSALLAVGILSLASHDPREASSNNSFRDQTLLSNHVRPSVIAYVDSFPFQLTDTATDIQGGGLSWPGSHWEVYSHQQEALIHEASHMWSYAIMNPVFCSYLDKTISQEQNPYFTNLYQVKGMKNNCTEEYASVSSWDMGDKAKMPADLQPLYQSLYIWP